MADAVTVRTVQETPSKLVLHLTNISDGTGESNVIKCDKSTLSSRTNIEPVSLDIEQVRWNIQGMTYVKITWDHTTDDTALVLSGSGFDDYRYGDESLVHVADSASLKYTQKGLRDPRSAGDTGDILLTTVGAVSGATYDITLVLHKSVT